MIYVHPLLTGIGLLLALLSYAGGQQLRKRRRRGKGIDEKLRHRHVRMSRLPVSLMLLGAVAGLLSHAWLERGPHMKTLHAWAGASALLLFVAGAVLGIAVLRERSHAKAVHGLLGFLALALALLAAVTGIELLP